MLIIPAIDLKDGKCVRLKQGDMDSATVFSDDPGATAKRWLDLGARRLHVVDLNGASAGKPKNGAAIKSIIGAVGVNFGRSILTNYFPELWPFFLGGLFIAVVLLFPDGLVGLMRRMNTDVIRHLFVKGKPAPEGTQP